MRRAARRHALVSLFLVTGLAVVAPFPTVAARAAAPGWAGEQLVGGTDDEWEPTIAADPSSSYVYVMYNRFGGAKACQHCPIPAMLVQVSADGGQTWGAKHFVCTCSGVSYQYDPTLKVTSSGTVYGTWMNTSTIVFAKSVDHGATFSTPIPISGNSWADKPWMGISPSGQDVYVAYESRSLLMITSSHDSGATWSPPLKVNSDTGHYRYPNGFVVLPNGTAILAASSYPNGSGKSKGNVDIETWRTTNGGTSWSRVIADSVTTGVDFDTSSTTTVASDQTGALVLEYTGATAVGGNGHVWVRRSTNAGLTWSSPRTELTPASGAGNASFPADAATGTGAFTAIWQEGRGGAWNTYARTSTDGGVSWSAEVRISDASSGAPYKTAAGYGGPYGDYPSLSVTPTGKAIGAWGEGVSFSTGPGGIWVNRQI